MNTPSDRIITSVGVMDRMAQIASILGRNVNDFLGGSLTSINPIQYAAGRKGMEMLQSPEHAVEGSVYHFAKEGRLLFTAYIITELGVSNPRTALTFAPAGS